MSLELKHPGKTALFHNGKFIRAYELEERAYVDGFNQYGLGNFSLFVVGEKHVIEVGAIGLGFAIESNKSGTMGPSN